MHLLIGELDAQVGARCKRCSTSLHWACCYGQESIVHILVEGYAAPLDAKDKGGETPCDLARRNGRTAIADYLESQVRRSGASGGGGLVRTSL